MPKPPRKHGKIEESEIDELAKVEAMLEFKRIEGCSLAKHRSIGGRAKLKKYLFSFSIASLGK